MGPVVAFFKESGFYRVGFGGWGAVGLLELEG